MKCATLPGQQAALARRVAEIRAEGRRQLSRRTVLGVGLGGFFGVTSGSLATLGVTARTAAFDRRDPSPALREPSPELAWARQLAVGRLPDLLDAQLDYARAMTQTAEIDDVLWVGVMRLSSAVIDGHPGTRPDLGRLLRPLAERHDVPVGLRQVLQLATCEPAATGFVGR